MIDDREDERGFFAEQPPKSLKPAKPVDEKPHYLGHRQRLRERFREAGPSALSDWPGDIIARFFGHQTEHLGNGA